jgi:hypothetical protein
MRRTVTTLAIVLGIALAGGFGLRQQPTSAQDPSLRKKPACTIYCCDSCADTITLGQPPACWGGPLSAAGAGGNFRNFSEADQASICRNLRSRNVNTSCPTVKTILGLCGKDDAPKEEAKKPPCKERGPYDVPWFDPSAEGCQNLQDTRMNANWTAAGGGTCTITLTACNYTVLTDTTTHVREHDGKVEPVQMVDQLTSEQLASAGIRRIRRADCNPQLYENSIGDYPNVVCCDIWREAVRAGGNCNPERDADCDGRPNNQSAVINAVPYYAPPRTGEAADFNPADFDPRPRGLNWDELMPNEPCKKCKWMATSGKLTCSPDGRREHEYKATWVCPSSGVTRTVTKRAPASAPCTPPQRPGA